MIDVTSMSEQSQLFIMWLQIILIILLILRLGRLALYFIKKDNDKFKKLVSSLLQLVSVNIFICCYVKLSTYIFCIDRFANYKFINKTINRYNN